MGKTSATAVCLGAAVIASSTLYAAPGDTLLNFQSSAGTLPKEQGWEYDARCLKTYCPGTLTPTQDPPLWWYEDRGFDEYGNHIIKPTVGPCFYQGQRDIPEVAGPLPGGETGGDQVPDNDCRMGIGCTTAVEHYNAARDVTDIPLPGGMPVGVNGACRRLEWLAFDDGEDYIGESYPVPPPHRNLTYTDAYWGPHAVPAYGAPGFLNAPTYPALRIAAGGGVPGVETVPDYSHDVRINSRVRIRSNFTIDPGVQAVTLVAKMAAGNQHPSREMLQLRAFDRVFSVGVNGLDGDPNLGQIGCGPEDSSTAFMFGDSRVNVRLARMGTWGGVNQGEFFTIRIILKSNGGVSAWLNDSATWTGTAAVKVDSPLVQFGAIDTQGSTMWFDYVQLLEGEVLPGCADPVFDVNLDGKVDNDDFVHHEFGFLTCATGPKPSEAVFAALPDMCKCHDVNQDQAIDMEDYAVFQRCLSTGAPGQDADPACDDLQ